MSNTKVDVIGQYISLVLIPRLNTADKLTDAGRYYEAVNKQLSVIRCLYRDTEEDEEKLKSWIKEIKSIDERTLKIRRTNKNATLFAQAKEENRLARILYAEIDWVIWGKLHGLGYFSGKKGYGPNIKDVDMSQAVEV